jgi:hypothetical protein
LFVHSVFLNKGFAMTAVQTPWQLSGWQARLMLGTVAGEVDLRQPLSGLALSAAAAKLRLFRVELPPPTEQPRDEAPECYVRGQDLVGTYLRDGQQSLRAQIYWRAFLFGPGEAPAVDLIVSVQTSLLDSDPTLNVRSVVPTREILNVNNLEPPTAEEHTPRASDNVVSFEGRDPACWLFRLAGADTTYVEMVHPSDFVSSRFQEVAPGDIEHSTRLFRGPLEKGVILRSRLRGVFVPRSDDIRAAVDCYRDFVASEPPLTT